MLFYDTKCVFFQGRKSISEKFSIPGSLLFRNFTKETSIGNKYNIFRTFLRDYPCDSGREKFNKDPIRYNKRYTYYTMENLPGTLLLENVNSRGEGVTLEELFPDHFPQDQKRRDLRI